LSERAIRLTRERIQHHWAERGYTCDLWVDPPGTVWADFVKDENQLVLVLDGSLLLEMQGRKVSMGPGDEVMVPAGVRHTVRNLGTGTLRWLCGHQRAQAAAN
jgi:mannose-6-phosphate isomerase-like protein (cupin superfamily)